jgi:hypothetical protein
VKPGKIYVLKERDQFPGRGFAFKIGRGKIPDRLKAFRTGNPRPIQLCMQIEVPDVVAAETTIKRIMAAEGIGYDPRGGTEWFEADPRNPSQHSAIYKIGGELMLQNVMMEATQTTSPQVPPIFIYGRIGRYVPPRGNVIANAIDSLGRAPEGYTEDEIAEVVADMRRLGFHNFKTGQDNNLRNALQRNCPDSAIFKKVWQGKDYAPAIIQIDKGIRGKSKPRWGLAEWVVPNPLKKGE